MTSVQRLTPGVIGSIRHESVSILGARSFILIQRAQLSCMSGIAHLRADRGPG